MKIITLNRVRVVNYLIWLIIVLILAILYITHRRQVGTTSIFMGGELLQQSLEKSAEIQTISIYDKKLDFEKYFRPSKLPILNNRPVDRDVSDVSKLPDYLFKSPEDTIINYFSLLREAANHVDEKNAGCGTIGNARLPYPIAYKFLSPSYQHKISYEQYLKSHENILHTSLIKMKPVPKNKDFLDEQKYFVEIESIKGSENDSSYFAYYYGFICLSKDKNLYKISDIKFYSEIYLCAPYHGWAYMGEAVVDIKYGGWCKLVKERYPTKQDGYVKNIYFKGTDGNDYLIVFFTLTNDTDIEVAQYIKDKDGRWILIHLDPQKCLEGNECDSRNDMGLFICYYCSKNR